MATKNKPFNINVNSFSDRLKENKEPEDLRPTTMPHTSLEDQTKHPKAGTTESKPPKTVSRMREKFLKREFRQYVPFDDQSQMQLSSIKALARIGMKDFIFFATVQELERRFPDGTVTPEGIEKLKKDFKKLFGE